MTLKYASKINVTLYILLSIIYASGNVAIAYVSKLMLNNAQYQRGGLTQLLIIALLGSLIIVIIMFSNFAYKYLKNKIILEINLELKKRLMTHLMNKNGTSQKEGLNLMTNDLKQIETLKISNELLIITEIFSFVLSLVAGLLNIWFLTIIFMITTLLPGLIQKLFVKKIQSKSKKWEQRNANYTQRVSDGLNGAVTANLYNARNSVLERIITDAKSMENALKSLNYTQDVANQIIIALADIFSFILPFFIGAVLMYNGQIGSGTLIMIVQLSNNFINPIVNIFDQLNQIKSTEPIWKKIEVGLNDVPTAPNDQKQTSNRTFKKLQTDSLTYNINGKNIFTDLSLTIPHKSKVLITAPSGWGKSTFLQLLLGKLKPDSGKILIDSENITNNWETAHNYFSYVTQSPFIFDDTLEFNITLGKKYPSKKLNAVIEKAGLKELVDEKGLTYSVGEKGKNLSGGQIQRIEIARALLSDRPIMLADEATSALDQKLSEKIHSIILDNPRLTVIEVAHKISTKEKEKFDKVLKLDELAKQK